MILGQVTGNVVSTNKEEKLQGYKLLIVRPLSNFQSSGDIVAIDRVGAGVDSYVLVTFGSSARLGLSKDNVPADAAIVGIVD